MSAEWPYVSLAELYDIRSGLSKPAKDFGTGFPFLSFKDVFYNFFAPDTLTELVQTTERERESCSVKRGDVFLTRTSETIHELGMSCVALKDYEQATFNGFTKRLRPKGGTDLLPEYVGYYLRSPSFRKEMMAFSTLMSTRASLNNEMISRLKLLVPPRKEQEQIAYVLKTLDNKIELNRQINQTLEEMAQAIFKSWFVDFEPVKAKIEAKVGDQDPERAAMCAISGKTDAELDQLPPDRLTQLRTTAALFPDQLTDSELGPIPKGWEVKKLEEVVDATDYVANGSFASLKANVELFDEENDVLYVRTTDFNNGFGGNLKYTTLHAYEFLSKSKLFGRETIISNVGDVGTVFRPPKWLNKPMTLASNAIVLLSKQFNAYVYCYFRASFGQHQIQSIVTGSAQLKFNKTNLRSLRMLWPNKDLLDFFEVFEINLDRQTVALKAENNQLTQLRDTLLPKLLSGEISLGDAQTTIKEAV